MKKTTILVLMILLFSSITNAQDNFENQWLKVEHFEVDNLPKSALKIVEEIYIKAKNENNSSQLIKTLFYKSKFALILEENAQLKVINEFKKHISESKFPTKNILENILANLYWQYFNQHRYQFYNRTKAPSSSVVKKGDFRTWDLNTLFKEIHTHYQNSLTDNLLLQQTSIYDFATILQVQKGSEIYRPTLFDFLANNALEFYKTSETNITKPNYQFKTENPKYLEDSRKFSLLDIHSKDSLSLQFNALKIYQNLTIAHIHDKDFRALTAIDLERLQFVKQHATFENKETYYLKVLKNSIEKYKTNNVSGLYAYEIAKIYHLDANSYASDKNEENRLKNKKSIAICNQIVKKFPESLGAKKCKILKAQIEQKSLSITSEKFVPTNSNSRLLINYKNIVPLYFTAYKINQTQLRSFHKIYKEDSKIKFIQKLEKIISWESKLRNEGDYLQHTTEVIVPKLERGSYLIVASEKNQLNSKEIFGTTFIQSTNLTLIENNFDGKYNYQVVNRVTGKPISNAAIHIKNYSVGRYNKSINRNLSTDKNGFASFRNNNRYSNVVITVSHNKDEAFFGDYYLYQHINNNSIQTPKAITKTFIFTDRSIYRPGQIVYFKGISIETFKEKSTVISNEDVSIILKDVNRQEINELNLKTNDFGSFSGEFIIPNNGLTGNYSIETSIDLFKNYAQISVEEYKRPKFETEFKPITESYKINDSITINGFVKAFSGANISDGKVVYRVHRKVQYPSWYYWRRPNFSLEAQEITSGVSTTDEKGEFKITFKAIPDESVSRENLPVFTYEITADVTDVNGESRSATSTVKIGFHSLLANINLDGEIDKNTQGNLLKVDTKNLNNKFIPAKGTIKIYKLIAPESPLRKRIWNAPDYQDISKNEFRKLFPDEPYTNDESDVNNWKKGAVVFETDFDTSAAKEIKLEHVKKWLSGKYIAVLESKDKFEQEVKDEQRFSVFSFEDKKVSDNQLFEVRTDQKTYKPDENVLLQLGSSSKNITIIVQVEKNHTIIETCLVHLNNQTKTLEIPVNKKDIGGFTIKYHFVNLNYFESGNLLINVPQEQNNIEIETNIFRDKLQPGQDETWSFTIKNDTNDKVAAEVLVSMYDASLDEFKPHNWQFNPLTRKKYYSYNLSSANNSFGTNYFQISNYHKNYFNTPKQQFDSYNWFGFHFGRNRNFMLRRMASASQKNSGRAAGVNVQMEELAETEMSLDEIVVTALGVKKEKHALGYSIQNSEVEGSKIINKKTSFDGIQIRKNFKETAFFFPQLRTNKDGKVSFNFAMPEALTSWKLQLLAHTSDLKSATKTLTTVTQKELMVVPNAPRFFREGDTISFSAKISNLTNNQLSGFAQLQLNDAITGKEINTEFENQNNTKNFTVDNDGNTSVSWNLSIPESIQAVQYKIVAKAGSFSDGEQNVLPVLSNRILATETLPMWVRSNETKAFTLEKLKNNASTTLRNHKLTLEMTSNPAWYAIQSLPYLMEYPYECAEQTFSRYYANTLASFVANSNPRIQDVFNAWKSSNALLSNLEKNQELKSLIIQETPWLRDAQSETEQKKRIALLFDLNKMKNEQEKSINKLKNIQMNSGGFSWFKGGRYPSVFITQHIASGFGHLQKLGISKFDKSTQKMIEKSVQFLDKNLIKKYDELIKRAEKIKQKEKTQKDGNTKYINFLAGDNLSYFTIQYLYMRSFYGNIPQDKKLKTAITYYQNQTEKYWNDYNLYAKGQIALSLFRTDKKTIANKILKSLKENSITSDELGMYWKANVAGYYNYQAPVETQSLLIETFSEIENDTKTIDNLKIWLLKNKQTNRWKTTKATTEAVYALLLNGSDWIGANTEQSRNITEMVAIKVGNKNIDPTKLENVKIEAGTGYFKTSWNGREITPKMSQITISKKGNGIAWGGLYWQYFEDLDKITSAKTPLQLNKKLFLKVNSDTGKELKEITNKTAIKVGDLITVRIELSSDRDMEFIHMKDMRASGVEPINVLSRYKWQDGLGYYENTKDAATNFFFDRLPKGIYVFEYDVRVNNSGNFSNGITTIQSMYAPEFSNHSEGTRINVLKK